MILVIDCGNTNTVFALYSHQKKINQLGCWRINNDSKRTADMYYPWFLQMLSLSNFKPNDIIVVNFSGRGDKDLNTYIDYFNL